MGRQYISDPIESVQKRVLKIVFLPLCYEDALKKSGLISLPQSIPIYKEWYKTCWQTFWEHSSKCFPQPQVKWELGDQACNAFK